MSSQAATDAKKLTKISSVSKVPLHRSTSGLIAFSIAELSNGFQALELLAGTSGIGFLDVSKFYTIRLKNVMRRMKYHPGLPVYRPYASKFL